MVEQLLTEHFDVEVEQLRKESEGYSEEFGTYIEPEEAENSAAPGRISGAQEKDGTLVLVVDLYSPQSKVYNTSVLTIQLKQAESEKEIARLVERRYLTAQQANSLDREAIRAYYRSELFERIEKSARVRREFAFQAQLGAEQLQTVLPNIGKHRVTVQGIADLIFEEADGWTLVDFKTDRVADGAVLLQRYREQLELYAQMLSKTNGIPICRKVIYSLFLHREIEVE